MPESILIVTPVWNDAARLAAYGNTLASAFAESPLAIHWIVADDGSSKHEVERLQQLHASFAQAFPRVSLHLADAHRGKGSIIREAWALKPEADWLAFADADGSVSAEDLIELIHIAQHKQQSVIGIRKRTAETDITESLWRAIFHHGYLMMVHLILGLRSEDLQCGAKIIRGDDYRNIAQRLEESRYSFDTELLSTLNRSGASWLEIPVTWAEKKGGKVRPLIDAWSMFAALIRIRKRRR